jgi:hypothetical protein
MPHPSGTPYILRILLILDHVPAVLPCSALSRIYDGIAWAQGLASDFLIWPVMTCFLSENHDARTMGRREASRWNKVNMNVVVNRLENEMFVDSEQSMNSPIHRSSRSFSVASSITCKLNISR